MQIGEERGFQNCYRFSVISVTVTKRGLLGSGGLYGTSGTIG